MPAAAWSPQVGEPAPSVPAKESGIGRVMDDGADDDERRRELPARWLGSMGSGEGRGRRVTCLFRLFDRFCQAPIFECRLPLGGRLRYRASLGFFVKQDP
jgi:hypothetical protein